MVSSTPLSRVLALCTVLGAVTAGAAPRSPPHAALARRGNTIPSGPKFVLYSQTPVTPVLPDLSQIQGFNVFNLAFLLSDGPHDQAAAWAATDPATRAALKAQYNAAGVALVVSAFGATELPTSAGADPAALAAQMAQFVKQTDLDGIDVDWEEVELVRAKPGVGEKWLGDFTRALRAALPQGQFILTHAPVAPWFAPDFVPGGGYLVVHKDVGALIDWYNIQFYNQSPTPGYEDCASLITAGGGSAVLEIAASGVDKSKIVVGKPGAPQDTVSGGYMDPAALSACLAQAQAQGWDAGVMVFQYPHADTHWVSAAKGSGFKQPGTAPLNQSGLPPTLNASPGPASNLAPPQETGRLGIVGAFIWMAASVACKLVS
ncbi:chitinase [Epithele typhae]|uniref:chitinase n=1 Tax=Epithele typhae TaxID=378194 RepID=UPI00200877BD|nr:chitinase [Epithele typhae]KAH9920847.1 chitinase [Epithele typhae]